MQCPGNQPTYGHGPQDYKWRLNGLQWELKQVSLPGQDQSWCTVRRGPSESTCGREQGIPRRASVSGASHQAQSQRGPWEDHAWTGAGGSGQGPHRMYTEDWKTRNREDLITAISHCCRLGPGCRHYQSPGTGAGILSSLETGEAQEVFYHFWSSLEGK